MHAHRRATLLLQLVLQIRGGPFEFDTMPRDDDVHRLFVYVCLRSQRQFSKGGRQSPMCPCSHDGVETTDDEFRCETVVMVEDVLGLRSKMLIFSFEFVYGRLQSMIRHERAPSSKRPRNRGNVVASDSTHDAST